MFEDNLFISLMALVTLACIAGFVFTGSFISLIGMILFSILLIASINFTKDYE